MSFSFRIPDEDIDNLKKNVKACQTRKGMRRTVIVDVTVAKVADTVLIRISLIFIQNVGAIIASVSNTVAAVII